MGGREGMGDGFTLHLLDPFSCTLSSAVLFYPETVLMTFRYFCTSVKFYGKLLEIFLY